MHIFGLDFIEAILAVADIQEAVVTRFAAS